MSNIEKDIEIVKEVQGIFEHLKNHGWIKDITKEVDINKVIPAISRTIEYVKYAELTKIACCTAQNCEALNNAIRLGKELENKDRELEKYKNENNELKEQIKDLRALNVQHLAKGLNESIANKNKNDEQLSSLNEGWKITEKELRTEIDKHKEQVDRLETKLMFALSPTNHELALDTQRNFKRIIRENLKSDTYTIRRELKKYWDDTLNYWYKKEAENDKQLKID